MLHEALLASGANVHLNFEVASIENFAAPLFVSAPDKREGPFDLLIDCAGAHDELRNTLGKRVHAPVYPWGAFWTTCPDRTGAFEGKLRQMYARAHTMMGVLPVGRVPGGTAMNFRSSRSSGACVSTISTRSAKPASMS